jgi:hypothetical protein
MSLWNWASNRLTVHPPNDMSEYGAAVELYKQGETEGLR